MKAFMAILYPRAGHRSDIGSGHSNQTVWGVNPTKDAHQQLTIEKTQTQTWQAGSQASYHWTNQRVGYIKWSLTKLKRCFVATYTLWARDSCLLFLLFLGSKPEFFVNVNSYHVHQLQDMLRGNQFKKMIFFFCVFQLVQLVKSLMVK